MKASKDSRAGNFVYGLGMSADTKGLVAKKATQAQTLSVTKNAKFFSNVDVNAHATFGSATIKGKLYVGKRAIGDVVTSMEKEMAAMRAEVAETKENLRQMLAMMKK